MQKTEKCQKVISEYHGPDRNRFKVTFTTNRK